MTAWTTCRLQIWYVKKVVSNKFTSSVVWNMYMHVYASIHCCLPPFQNISGFLHDGAMVYIHVSQMSCMVFPNRIKFRPWEKDCHYAIVYVRGFWITHVSHVSLSTDPGFNVAAISAASAVITGKWSTWNPLNKNLSLSLKRCAVKSQHYCFLTSFSFFLFLFSFFFLRLFNVQYCIIVTY